MYMPSQTRRRPHSVSTRKTRSVPTRRTGSVPTRRVSSKKTIYPHKFTRILVGNSPEKNSPTIFKPKSKPKSRRWFFGRSPSEIPDTSLPNHTNIMVPNSISPEYVEDYQRTQFTNYKSRQMMKDHLKKYIKNNPHSTYEQWIRELFPENTKINEYGHIELDKRLYLPQAESLKYWENIQKKKNKII